MGKLLTFFRQRAPRGVRCTICGILARDAGGTHLDAHDAGNGRVLCPKCWYRELFRTDPAQAEQFAHATCSHCGSDYFVESLAACDTCGKPGCQRCLARSVRRGDAGEKGAVEWHTSCPRPHIED